MYVRRPTSKFPGGPRRGLNGLRISHSMTGLSGIRRRRARLGDDAMFVPSGDVAPPDANILFPGGPVSQPVFTAAVVNDVNAQVTADNSQLIGPSLGAQASWWLSNSIMGNDPITGKPKTFLGQVIPNWLPIGGGVALLGAAVISAGGKRR